MMEDVIVNKGGDKEVGMVITRLQSQKNWDSMFLASFREFVGQQLIMQKFVIFPLQPGITP